MPAWAIRAPVLRRLAVLGAPVRRWLAVAGATFRRRLAVAGATVRRWLAVPGATFRRRLAVAGATVRRWLAVAGALVSRWRRGTGALDRRPRALVNSSATVKTVANTAAEANAIGALAPPPTRAISAMTPAAAVIQRRQRAGSAPRATARRPWPVSSWF